MGWGGRRGRTIVLVSSECIPTQEHGTVFISSNVPLSTVLCDEDQAGPVVGATPFFFIFYSEPFHRVLPSVNANPAGMCYVHCYQ